MIRHRPVSLHRHARWLMCVLALAICVAGTLGVVHASLHGPLHARIAQTGVAVTGSSLAGRAAASADAPGERGLFALFGDHHSDGDCRLYDQLAHGPAAVCVPAVVLPISLPTATFAWLEGESLARWVALFDARGPPPTR
jgi:hypothetical protein